MRLPLSLAFGSTLIALFLISRASTSAFLFFLSLFFGAVFYRQFRRSGISQSTNSPEFLDERKLWEREARQNIASQVTETNEPRRAI